MKCDCPLSFTDQIIRHATMFTGLREVKPNASWDNPGTPDIDKQLSAYLTSAMRAVDWEPGWAYCAAFVEAVCVLARKASGAKDTAKWLAFRKAMTPGVVRSFDALKKAGLTHDKPAAASIWFARHGTSSLGHCGLVTSANSWPADAPTMRTIEGNTTYAPTSGKSDREGDWITTRVRGWRTNGRLKTLGFVWLGEL